MKLSKSKLALAKVINENGGWVDGEAIFAAMDGNGDLFGYSGRPQWTVSHGHWYGHTFTCWFFSPIVINNHHQTILSREEYYKAYPKADADGWIEWSSDELPVKKGTIIDVKYSDGDELHGAPCGEFTTNGMSVMGERASAEAFGLGDGSFVHIVAYRLHKPEVKSEFCESVMRSIPEPEFDDAGSRLAKALELVKSAAPHMLRDKYKFDGNEVMGERKPTIEHLAQDYRNAKDYAERLQKEADEAKAAADAALGELERAGDALGLLIVIAKSDREPKLVITDWRDLMVGDVVEITGSSNNCWKDHSGREMTVKDVYPEQGDNDDQVDLIGESSTWCLGGNTTWRFIRRP